MADEANLVTTDALLLARHDGDVAAEAVESARELQVTAMPQHPGLDVVSRQFVDGLAEVLRGPGGIRDQLHAVADDFTVNAANLEAAARTYHETDADVAIGLTGIAERLEGR